MKQLKILQALNFHTMSQMSEIRENKVLVKIVSLSACKFPMDLVVILETNFLQQESH